MIKNTKTTLKFGYLICFELFFSLLVFDQITKRIAKSGLSNRKPFVIIKNVLEFNYLEGGNKGAAWGILKGHIAFLAILSIVITIIAFILIARIEYIIHVFELERNIIFKLNLLKVLLIFFAAGAMGNAIDRIFRRYVIDFIYFKLIDFPIFNVADCYVVVSTILLAIIVLFIEDDVLALINPKNKNDGKVYAKKNEDLNLDNAVGSDDE